MNNKVKLNQANIPRKQKCCNVLMF